jgi:hypothetical protein
MIMRSLSYCICIESYVLYYIQAWIFTFHLD